MAVSYNGSGTAGAMSTSYVASASITTYTVGAVTNGILIAVLNVDQSIISPTATWNGASMGATVYAPTYKSGTAYQHIWALVAPTAGNFTLAFSWTGNSPYAVSCAAFNGVDQSTPLGTWGNAQNVSTTPSSGAVTSGANDATLALSSLCDSGGAICAYSAPETQTGIYRGTSTGEVNNSVTYALGGSSNTHDFTSTNHSWIVSAVRLLAAAGGSSPVLAAIPNAQRNRRSRGRYM